MCEYRCMGVSLQTKVIEDGRFDQLNTYTNGGILERHLAELK